jgi:23S rRNA pseudouridine1911/1915/1917 synthase
MEERLDVYVANKYDISRTKAKKLIDEDKVLVNGSYANPSLKVSDADEIEVIDDLNYEITIEKENIPIDIVYEDEYLLIINKKSGMVVHPAPGNYTGTLVNALLYKFDLEGVGEKNRPGIVHRIDKDTSGLLVVAKNDKAHLCLSEQIASHTVTREYFAVVYGIMPDTKGTIDAPIGRSEKDRKKFAVTEKNSKNAITDYEVLETIGNYSFLKLRLHTGRTHQIRVHMSSIGHPLAGDAVYGPRNVIKELNGQCLHAGTLGFIHPRTGEYMEFHAKLPEYFTAFLAKLRRTEYV